MAALAPGVFERMERIGLACALAALGCQPAPQTPAAPARAGAAEAPLPSVVFVEKPGGILAWDFDIRGLPAADPRTGAIVVADLSHGRIASSLALSIRWLEVGSTREPRTLTVLDDRDASRVLYETDASEEPARTVELAAGVRARTKDANRVLSSAGLRPTTPCRVRPLGSDPREVGAFGCAPAQELSCGVLAAELHGDALSWQVGTERGTQQLDWKIPPMEIGDGPPKEMVTCIEEAHFDPASAHLAARIEHSCKGGGGDACLLPDEWRVVALRRSDR